MDTPADTLIDALGGTSAVAGMVKCPTSTVHSWRRDGIPESRFDHMRLAAKEQELEVDFDKHVDAIRENMPEAMARRANQAAAA